MGLYDAWAWMWLTVSPAGMGSTTFWPPRNDTYEPSRDVPVLSGKVNATATGSRRD